MFIKLIELAIAYAPTSTLSLFGFFVANWHILHIKHVIRREVYPSASFLCHTNEAVYDFRL
ncbi:hypothetical protein ACJ2_34330 [Pantoea sp. QMID2]|nr:hypothetical protein ACJ3_15140 [Pantoea sp. QMID3]GME35506.1 hypothetical protein ACJ1_15050 [Pantoea sp. QMID1]GME59705.1 hypothetical protein ACJ4_34250 [Pantoea sp. QMID4]GME61218.1 hypothetical protein ACJ2_34330 [Pantoea sp. QMID2]